MYKYVGNDCDDIDTNSWIFYLYKLYQSKLIIKVTSLIYNRRFLIKLKRSILQTIKSNVSF